MYIEIITTVTSKVKIGDDGIEGAEHSVSIDGGEFLEAAGQKPTFIVVKAGLQASLNSVSEMLNGPSLNEEIVSDDEDETDD